MSSDRDTIAAIATAPGAAGIAVVRISGPESLAIADALYVGNGPSPSRRRSRSFLHGMIRSAAAPDDAVVDEVILLIYRAPHSYTCEDVVEIQGHGGRTSARRVLRAVLDAGARAAEPGEFTRRAFLHGRIDLLQAEAVADLIQAQSDRAAGAAIEQLQGALSHSLAECYELLVTAAADLEASLDFDCDALPEGTVRDVPGRLDDIHRRLRDILATWEEGHLLRDGARVVIAGRPNVGKSTLLNRLLGTERAIVTATPGTTRDSIEESVTLNGIPLRLVDTAGLRQTDCHIEREGVTRAEALMRQADLLLYMIDASQTPCDEDRMLVEGLDPAHALLILNKADLRARQTPADFPDHQSVVCSLRNNGGLTELKHAIAARLDMAPEAAPHAVISERHRQLVQNALNELNDAIQVLTRDPELGSAPAASCLRAALETLGVMTGRTYTEELLDSIFSRFCIGK